MNSKTLISGLNLMNQLGENSSLRENRKRGAQNVVLFARWSWKIMRAIFFSCKNEMNLTSIVNIAIPSLNSDDQLMNNYALEHCQLGFMNIVWGLEVDSGCTWQRVSYLKNNRWYAKHRLTLYHLFIHILLCHIFQKILIISFIFQPKNIKKFQDVKSWSQNAFWLALGMCVRMMTFQTKRRLWVIITNVKCKV